MSGEWDGSSGGGSVGCPGWLGSGGVSGGFSGIGGCGCPAGSPFSFYERRVPRGAPPPILSLSPPPLGRARGGGFVDAPGFGFSIARSGGGGGDRERGG